VSGGIVSYARSAMPITCRLYKDGILKEKAFDPARVSDLLQEEGARVWLDVEDPTDDELTMIGEEFGLHPLSVEDTRHRGQRAKVEFFEKYFLIVLHALSLDQKDELIDSEIHAFAGHRYLLTLRYAPAFDVSEVLGRWDRRPEHTSEGGGFLFYALLDEIVDGYFNVVERFEDLSEDIEDRVFGERPDPDIQEAIFRLKRKVVTFRRLVIPLREVLDLIQEQSDFVTPMLVPYYRDVADHVIRTLEFVDTIRDLLTTALEAELSQVSNRMNEVMKTLTSWAAIILVPTLIAGIYGMNFIHMPELNWRFGYAWALGLMVASGLLLYRMFKRRDWL
jgi:magnesium transporter